MHELRFISSGPEQLFEVADLAQREEGLEGRMRLGRWAAGPDGSTAVGAFGVLADEVLGYALMASLAQGAWSISTEIWLDVVGPLPAPGAAVLARAHPLMAGSFAAGEVRDASGRTFLACRQRGRYVEPPAAREDELSGEQAVAPSGAVSLEQLLGLRGTGETFVLEASQVLANPRQMLHGGVSLAASELAATRSRLEGGCSLPTSSVHIVHTRGVPTGSALTFHCATRHAGRTLWVTEVIGTVGGKTCTVATVSAQE